MQKHFRENEGREGEEGGKSLFNMKRDPCSREGRKEKWLKNLRLPQRPKNIWKRLVVVISPVTLVSFPITGHNL